MEQKIPTLLQGWKTKLKLDKVFKGRKVLNALAQTGGDIAWFGDIREALDN